MVGFAVIGVGRMGSRHADNLAKGRVRGARLVALCDIDAAVRDKYSSRYKGVKIFSDYRELISSGIADAVVIATPHYMHVEIASATIAAGIHTLVEKPVSVTCKDALALNKTAAEHPDTVFGIMYNQRTNAIYRKIKSLVGSGAIGKVRRAELTITDWYRTQYYYDLGGWRASYDGEGGGTLINQCVHQLDILQWVLGMPESLIADCRTVGRDISTENEVCATLTYPDFNCMLFMSAHEFPGVNRLEIAGDKGRITASKFGAEVVINKLDEKDINLKSKRDYGNPADKKYKKYKIRYGLFNLIRDGLYGQQINILRDFARRVGGDKTSLIAEGAEGINALALINAVYLSSWTGERVAVPVDVDKYASALDNKRAYERAKSTNSASSANLK
ncbi:MAG: Gfo/Idh/MocA family oxidoreductase [Clostridia bacterium]|nr:Gfo/Idh/MocA family oxidoreductase [Clostridia bacterium]